jgi:hypothetical protein
MRLFSHLLVIAAAASLAVPASAGPRQRDTLPLRAGESVLVALDDGGRIQESVRGPAARLTRFEAAAVWNLTNGVYGEAVGPNSAPIVGGENGIPDAPQIPAGAIRIKLVALGRDSTLLVVENGYRSALSYRARIRSPGRSRATDVCEVMPERYGIEHWPYRIDRIDLAQLRLIPWVEGQRPRCE